MKKSIYFFILLMLFTNFLDIKPIAYWMEVRNNVNGQIATVLWMALGAIIYRHPVPDGLYNQRTIFPFRWILVGIFLSMIPAYLFYGQSFTQSLITYRAQYFWFLIPLLLYIRPSEKDIIPPLNWFAFFFFITAFLQSNGYKDMFYLPEEKIKLLDSGYYKDELLFGDGFQLLLFPCYYYLGRLRKDFNFKGIFFLTYYVIIFFMLQNRSILFIIFLVIGYAIIAQLRRQRLSLFLFILFFGTFFFYQTHATWTKLLLETFTDLNNKDYNRALAFNYFLYEANPNWLTYFFGNGFLSSHTLSLVQDNMERKIFNSDMGFLGYWNQFGLIPIIVFLTCIMKAFFSKFVPFYVKVMAFHIIACLLTISYFGKVQTILWFSLFYYLMVYNIVLKKMVLQKR